MIKNVSPGLIENVKDLKIALNELTVHDLNVYSMIELYYKVAHKLNEVIKELSRFEGVISDEVVKQNEKLIYLLAEGLEIELVKEIDNLSKKGFFENIINEKIFSDLNNKIDTFKTEINSHLVQKANKNEVFTMANMGQDVKEAMTGGSVAVVGRNSVLNENIVEKQISADKTNFLEINSVNLYNYRSNIVGMLNTNGSVDGSSNYSTSNFIEVVEGKTIYISVDGKQTTKVLRVVGYNSNFEFVNVGSNFAKTYTVPTGVKYIKITGLTTDLNNNKMQLQYDKITSYEDYDKFVFNGGSIKEDTIDIKSFKDNAKLILPFSPKAKLEKMNKDCIEFLEIKYDGDKEFYFLEIFSKHATNKTRGFKIISTDGEVVIKKYIENDIDNMYPNGVELIKIEDKDIVLTIKIDWSKVVSFVNGTVEDSLISDYVIKNLNSTTDNIRIVIPPVIPIVEGKEMNVYYNNITLNADSNKLHDIFIQATNGAIRYKDRFTFIPQSSGVVKRNVKFATIDKSILKTSNDFDFNVVNSNVGNGTTKKVLIIGDSKTETRNYITDTLIDLFKNDVMNIELLGTRGTGISKHEGRMSWDANNYLYDENYNSYSNAFYNPNSTNDYKFDFAYYMKKQGYDNVDYVFINLGTNDTARYNYEKIIENYNKIISNIHSYNPNIKICLGMTENRSTRNISTFTLGREKETILELCEKLIYEFSNRENIYLVPLYLNLDLENDFEMIDKPISSRNSLTQKFVTDVLHPSKVGFEKSADVIYYFIKYLTSL